MLKKGMLGDVIESGDERVNLRGKIKRKNGQGYAALQIIVENNNHGQNLSASRTL